MSTRDERSPGFRLGRSEGHEEIVIPAHPPRGALVGAIVGLVLWPILLLIKGFAGVAVTGLGGIVVVLAVWFLIFLVYALLQVAWWLGGAERIAVIRGDLLVRYTILGLPIATRAYRGTSIRFLGVTGLPPRTGWFAEPILPFVTSHGVGSLKLFYDEHTIYLGLDLDEANARQALDWLARRLPAAAFEQPFGR